MDGRRTLPAPILLVYEVANALASKHGLNARVTARALQDLFNMQLDLVALSKEPIVSRGSELAYGHGITVHHSSHLSLGELLGSEVITADEELYRKAEDCEFLGMP